MFTSSNQRHFQKGLDTDKMRSSRRDNQLSLRRKAREEHLQKRMRRLSSSRECAPTAGGGQSTNASIDQIPKYVHNVMQTDSLQLQVSGAQSLRMLLSSQGNPPIDRVTECGVVPKIVSFISISNRDKRSQSVMDQKLRQELQHEAAWIVTNLASYKAASTLMVVNCGAIEKLVEMMRQTDDEEHMDLAVWALGNIAGEGKAMTDRLMATGFIDDFIARMSTMSKAFLANSAWTLSNVVRGGGHHKLSQDQLTRLITMLKQVVRTSNVPEAIGHALWSFSYLSNSETVSELLVKHGVVGDMIRLLADEAQKYERTLALKQAQRQKAEEMFKFKTNGGAQQRPKNIIIEAQQAMDYSVYKPCLRFLGNVLSGPDSLTQAVLDAGYLDVMEPFMNHFCTAQRKEIIWSLSNILAGSVQQIEAVLSRDSLVRGLIDATSSGTHCILLEATWCLGNATVDAISTQIKKLADYGAIEALCKLLSPAYDLPDKHIEIIVEALDAFMKIYGTDGYNPYADRVEENMGLDYLEDRQADDRISEDVYNSIVGLMQKYWGNDDFEAGNVEEFALSDQLAAEVDTTTNTFKFGCGGNGENMSILGNSGRRSNQEGVAAVYQF